MVTIHSSELFRFPRSYIVGIALSGTYVAASFIGRTLAFNDEISGLHVTLEINSEVYPARSRSYGLDEVIEEATCTNIITGDPASFDVYVSVDIPAGEDEFRFFITGGSMVEPATLFDLPRMGADYWLEQAP